MGLFDMFKSKNSANTDHSGPSADYMLAHYALRQLALDSPVQMLGLLASPEASQFLTELLHDVEKQLGHKASFTADQILAGLESIHVRLLNFLRHKKWPRPTW
jgi:hypothetical protein